MEQKKINRINELARKAKTQTLTPEELEEQKQLRMEYRMAVVGNLKQQLDHTVIIRPDGSRTELDEFDKDSKKVSS